MTMIKQWFIVCIAVMVVTAFQMKGTNAVSGFQREPPVQNEAKVPGFHVIGKLEDLHLHMTEKDRHRHLGSEAEPGIRMKNSIIATMKELATLSVASNVLYPGKRIYLPTPQGSKVLFELRPLQLMHPVLAKKYPEILTLIGHSVSPGPAMIANIDYNPWDGFHGQVFTEEGNRFYIDPFTRNDKEMYSVYSLENNERAKENSRADLKQEGLGCHTATIESPNAFYGSQANSENQTVAGQGRNLQTISLFGRIERRKYRIAIAANKEFSRNHQNTKASVQAAIVTALNRINVLFKSELAVEFELIPNNDELIEIGNGVLSNDPHAVDEAQDYFDTKLPGGNYDIGHVLITGGGGRANLGDVCGAFRGGAVSGYFRPIPDPEFLRTIVHEMGHQMGAPHTFNGVKGGCTRNLMQSTNYEPGSGSTIMSYAGACATDDIQATSDFYYHGGSLQKMEECIQFGACRRCGTAVQTTERFPRAMATKNLFRVPVQSKFRISALNTTPRTYYSWEQVDSAQYGTALGTEPNPVGAKPGCLQYLLNHFMLNIKIQLSIFVILFFFGYMGNSYIALVCFLVQYFTFITKIILQFI